MKLQTQTIPRIGFGLILICFLLPFVTISCAGQEIVTLSGLQLTTGETIETPSSYRGLPKKQQIPGELLAGLAFTSASVGLGVSFIKSRRGLIAQTSAGAAGNLLLLLLKGKLDHEVIQSGQGILSAKYDSGFWIAFLLFVATAGLSGSLLVKSRRS